MSAFKYAALLFVLAISGCTYTSKLDAPAAIALNEATQSQKLPASVAIVADNRLRNLVFSASGGGHGVEIQIGDAIIQSFNHELSNIFDKVSVVNIFPKPGEADFAAVINAQWKEAYRDSFSGSIRYDVLFRLQLEPVSPGRTSPYDFADSQSVTYSPGAGARAASFATGFSLFLLAPITVPLTTAAVGSQASDMLSTTITNGAQAIAAKVSNSTTLRDALAPTSVAPTEPESATAEALPQPSLSSSPYDHFLDAVILVVGSDTFGTGFFISASGIAVTNAHVVEQDAVVTIKERNGRISRAQVISRAPEYDLALLKIEGNQFTWLALAPVKDIGIGRDVLAIGAPKGLTWSVSKGIVSAVRQLPPSTIIQTDAAVNKGNSGGPLIDLASGKAIGVNSFKLREQTEGLGFAVSAEDVRRAFPRYPINN